MCSLNCLCLFIWSVEECALSVCVSLVWSQWGRTRRLTAHLHPHFLLHMLTSLNVNHLLSTSYIHEQNSHWFCRMAEESLCVPGPALYYERKEEKGFLLATSSWRRWLATVSYVVSTYIYHWLLLFWLLVYTAWCFKESLVLAEMWQVLPPPQKKERWHGSVFAKLFSFKVMIN